MEKNILFKNLRQGQYYDVINFSFRQNFIGKLIKRGNKFYALKIFNKLKFLIKNKFKKDPNILLFLTLYYSIVKFYFIKKRFGGSKKEIPIYLNRSRQVKFIIKKMFSYSKSLEKRKSLNLNKLVNLYLITIKKKGYLILNKYKSFLKAKENRILIKSLKK